MTDEFLETLAEGLKPKHTHVDPFKALKGISMEMVLKKLNEKTPSIYELLHHLVVWQDLTIEALQGHDVIWPDKGKDWPEENEIESDEWQELIQQFTKGLERAEIVAEMLESETKLPAWNDMPASNALRVLIQHNSYHMGQIVTMRRVLGIWPPEE
ncbi:MAG: hypothetical protein GF411_20150 [Candidatus Lokiarchaeota archaeon]|nr:hypothetical protein [Candidatus Lokiarchaeota archaeon]